MRLILVLLASFILSGCFPYRYTHRPGVGGTVVSAHTHRPILGATVALDGPGGHASTSSAADGSFAIPPLFQWGLYIIPMDVWALSYALSVTHSAFQPHSQDVRSHPMSGSTDGIKNLGVIPLKPL